MTEITIRRATYTDKPEWLRMRLLLWPDEKADDLSKDMDSLLDDPLTPVFAAVRSNGVC